MAAPTVEHLAGQMERQLVDLTVAPKAATMVGYSVEAKAVTKAVWKVAYSAAQTVDWMAAL